jgi:uncharacterized iron-regulated membrane protein
MRVTARYVVLTVHLYLGLAAAVFLLILAATGTVMAFEHDIERWVAPKLWLVTVGQRPLPEDQLIRIAQTAFSPARVASVQISPRADVVHVMQMTDRAAVYINPWDGTITGRVVGTTRTQRYIGYIHQLHLRLLPNPRSAPSLAGPGKLVVSFAGLLLCALVPTGITLWWRAKRASIRMSGSWFRICFDAHQAFGIYACVFLFIAAFTGVMVGFDVAEGAIYFVMHSPRPNRSEPPQASNGGGRAFVSVDQAMAAARGAVPGGIVIRVQTPDTPRAVFAVQLRAPIDVSEDSPIPVTVYVDPYSAVPIHVQDLFAQSPGYRMVRLNRAIHTGDFWGLPGHILMSLSSLALGAMVITGLVIWGKKLAGNGGQSPRTC